VAGKESESYYGKRIKKVNTWDDSEYRNPNKTKNINCTQIFEIEKMKQRYLLVYVFDPQE